MYVVAKVRVESFALLELVLFASKSIQPKPMRSNA